MRKRIAFVLCLIAPSLFAQFSLSIGGILKTDADGVDAIVVFNGINSESKVIYTGTGFIEWQKRNAVGVYENYMTLPEMSPDEGGYRVRTTGGNFLYIWVFDYADYLISIDDMRAVFYDEDKCSSLSVEVTFSDLTKKMLYRTSTGETKEFPRIFKLSYSNVKWNESAWSERIPNEVEQPYPFTSISLESPLCNTSFVLEGDEYAKLFGVDIRKESDIFQAIATEAYPKGVIAKRDALNELDKTATKQSGGGTSKNCVCEQEFQSRIAGKGQIGGSAPLVVDFKSNANEDAADFYEWFIYESASPAKKIRYTDKNFRYMFNESGEYTVKLVASSSECEAVDSVNVTVLESYMDVPNVFTPNGDGANDEFRIVYRSLIDFKGWVYNRWGRLVFKWTDPSKGWDGKINGKMAAPGAYYYVIQGIGSDKDKNGKPIEWKCSGDINLLRGKSR